MSALAVALATGACASPLETPRQPMPAANPSFVPHPGPIVIAHRGASGYLPEHTLAAYYLAIQQGADYVEPDLVVTRDGALVARHENEISATTDVGMRAEFAGRKARKTVDGEQVEGWFTEDFTLAELKTLRARERLPRLRPGNTRFDGMFEIPTLDEVLALVQALDWQRRVLAQQEGRPAPTPIGVYPETKHPSYFAAAGLAMEETLVRTLRRWGYIGRDAPVFIQSFETANLKALRKTTGLRLVQLVDSADSPYDFVLAGDSRTAADLLTPRGLAGVATYADAIGVNKSLIVPRRGDGTLGAPTALVADAHAAGLQVHAWTFRAENEFLPKELRSGADPSALGDMMGEVQRFLAAGVDGLFTDHPDVAMRAFPRK